MSLRIACDLDGTIADMDSALQREAERLFGPDISLRPPRGSAVAEPGATPAAPEVPGEVTGGIPTDPPSPGGAVARAAAEPGKKTITDRQMRELWAHVRRTENFWSTLAEIESGTVARFAALAAEHRWEVLFLTQRPATAGDTAQVQTQRWLHSHGFALPSVYVMNGSRGKVAQALAIDAVIDDRPENCVDVVSDSQAMSVLIWRDDPAAVPPGAARLGITVVHAFSEALDQMLALMATRQKPKGLVERVKAAIGMNARP